MTRLLDAVPDFYARFLPDLFQRDITDEAKATCDSCAMCEANCQNAVSSIDGKQRLFRPDTKCCTYHPRLPNYLVGAILSDQSPEMAEGRRRLEERIRSRIGITPHWLRPPAKYNLLYGNARLAFGNDAVALPRAAWPLLTAFSGEDTVPVVRERLRREHGADLSEEILLTLYRYRVLTTPG